MTKTFEAAWQGMVCSHAHKNRVEADACREKWMTHLRTTQNPIEHLKHKTLLETSDPKRGLPFVREKKPHGKQQIWCDQCNKYIPYVRWSGHYERNHGISSPGRRPHISHKMTKWRTEIRCPGSTERFYGVRECRRCGLEELYHPAGHFNDGLREPCIGVQQ